MPKGKMSYLAQKREAHATWKCLQYLVKSGEKLVITHGNGPQVGALLKRSGLRAFPL